jgi:hypothetical protein
MMVNGQTTDIRSSLPQVKQMERPTLNLQPMSDLDLMIANGWGDTPQKKLPENWRTKKNPKGRAWK